MNTDYRSYHGARDGWTTEREIAFLNAMGGFSMHPMPRERLLAGYIAGAAQRSDWGAIDPIAVIAHARKLLLEASAKPIE
jgi:hypothetical protein